MSAARKHDNPWLAALPDYPFVRLARLLDGLRPGRPPLDAGAGEPRVGKPPAFVQAALADALDRFGRYPPTRGEAFLREAVADWLLRRYGVKVDPAREVLSANGTREALFAVALAFVNPEARPFVAMPNPMYQIYLGGAALAGARPLFLPCRREQGFAPDLDAVAEEDWARCAFVYVCSPSNPTGWAADPGWWERLFRLADRHDFFVVADECYSEVYLDAPPVGALEACRRLGREGFARVLVMNSLSKRSGLPGLRSGFIAGDAELVARFAKLRSYTGPATPGPLQVAAARAWADEAHVERNRRRYAGAVSAFFAAWPGEEAPPRGGFFAWLFVGDDEDFARRAWVEEGVKVLPGSYLGAETEGGNPGRGFVRVALVEGPEVAREIAGRLARVREGSA